MAHPLKSEHAERFQWQGPTQETGGFPRKKRTPAPRCLAFFPPSEAWLNHMSKIGHQRSSQKPLWWEIGWNGQRQGDIGYLSSDPGPAVPVPEMGLFHRPCLEGFPLAKKRSGLFVARQRRSKAKGRGFESCSPMIVGAKGSHTCHGQNSLCQSWSWFP